MTAPEKVHDKHSRGVLTEKLREKLESGDLNGNDRFRIRKYIENMLLVDFHLLSNELAYRDRERVFAQKAEPDEGSPSINQPDPDILDGVADAIEFLFLGLVRRGEDWAMDHGEHHVPAFETALECGLARACEKHQLPLTGVDLHLRTEQNRDIGPAEMKTLLRHMDPLPGWVPEQVRAEGWIDEEEYREFLIEQIEANATG